MLRFVLPATMISFSSRGKLLNPVLRSMKQWAADRIVSSSRIVPPQSMVVPKLLKLALTLTCQGMGDGAIKPPTILPSEFIALFFIHVGMFEQVCPEPISKLKTH